jgi:hypothetical protein
VTGGGKTVDVAVAQAKQAEADRGSCRYVYACRWSPSGRQQGENITSVAPGGCAFIPRGAPHAWKNVGSEPGRVLFVYAPAKAGTVFEALAKNGGKPPVDGTEIMDWLRQHDAEVVGAEPF